VKADYGGMIVRR